MRQVTYRERRSSAERGVASSRRRWCTYAHVRFDSCAGASDNLFDKTSGAALRLLVHTHFILGLGHIISTRSKIGMVGDPVYIRKREWKLIKMKAVIAIAFVVVSEHVN
ncbi:hypothetical protein EVAR_34744_1 [Eumeta japonica]|uniref:Uncharacterized protein n=1 Tax=Eumeta variegata TaxID=151549 RepID=A0A4C1YH30_EUMVA|nr:hypothetical protein EVAR_34744_1 [Eumeta japonica]